MSLRGLLRRLERVYQGETIFIPQEDGAAARFREADLAEAYLIANAREGGQTRYDHPLSRACRNSSDIKWRDSVFAGPSDEELPEEELEDLSEPTD